MKVDMKKFGRAADCTVDVNSEEFKKIFIRTLRKALDFKLKEARMVYYYFMLKVEKLNNTLDEALEDMTESKYHYTSVPEVDACEFSYWLMVNLQQVYREFGTDVDLNVKI